MWKSLLVTCLLLACLLLGLAAPASSVTPTRVERTVDAPKGAAVEITNIAGSVAITGWDRPQVRVTGTLGPEVETLVVKPNAERVLVAVIVPRFHSGEIDAQLRIHVPRSLPIRVESVSASVAAEGVEGALDFETVSGPIDVEGKPGSVRVKTVGGPIDVEGQPGVVVAETVSGRIEIEAETSDVRVTSVSGSVTLRGGVHGHIQATSIGGDLIARVGEIREGVFGTISGTVRVAGTLALNGSLEVGNQQGEIELRLPTSTSALFDLRTQTGRIYQDFGPEPVREHRSSVLEFKLMGGDGTVIALSYGGDVSLLIPE